MATSQSLQAAVHKATTPNWDAAPEAQEGDPIAMVEITEAISANMKLLPDLVKFLKARIKDQNTQVTFIALDVTDQCMESCGFAFQALVQKKALERIGKISAGAKGIPEMVRSKAANCITKWGDCYGSDPRLEGFKKAALQVKSREVKDVREAFSEELKEMAEMKEAARVANEADAQEVKAAMKEMGIEPKEPAQAAQAKPQKRGFFSFKSKVDKKKAAEAAAQLQKEEQEARNQMTYVVLMGRAKEASETLGAIIEGSSAEDLQTNEAAQEVVVTCMKYQTHLEVLASSVQEDEKVAACIALNEEITERVNLYQQFVTGQVQPGELLSVPLPRIGSGGTGPPAIRTAPVVEESTSTLSDASAIFKGQITTAGLPPPDYSESDEDDDGGDLINFGSPDTSGAAGGAAGGDAAAGSTDFNFGKEPPKVDELYKPATAESTEDALKDVFGDAAPPPPPPAMGRESSNLGGGSNPFDAPAPPPVPDAPAAAGGGASYTEGEKVQVMGAVLSPLQLDKAAFDTKFDACGMSLGDVINTSARWKTADAVRGVVEGGLCMAIVDAGDDAIVLGSATYPGAGGEQDCFVKLEAVSEGTFLMDVRAADDQLKNALESAVKELLATE